MKYQQLQVLEKEWAKSDTTSYYPIFLIVSKEEFPRKQAAEKILNVLLKDRDRSLSFKMFEGESVSLDQLFREVANVSFLSDLIVVHVLHAEKLKKNIVEALLNYLQRPSHSAVIVLSAESWPAASSFYKRVEECGVLLQLAPEKAWEKEKNVRGWVLEKVAQQHKTFAPGAAEALIKQMGADQLLLETELDKLFCYVGNNDKISVQDVLAVSGSASSETVWQLGESILQKNGSQALKIGRVLMEDGNSIFALLQQVRRQFEIGLQIISLLRCGGSKDEVTRLYPYMKGSILEKNISQAQGYGEARFKRGLIVLHETELKAKNSGGDPDLLLELLLVKLTVIG